VRGSARERSAQGQPRSVAQHEAVKQRANIPGRCKVAGEDRLEPARAGTPPISATWPSTTDPAGSTTRSKT
jgi:hypothetical protein